MTALVWRLHRAQVAVAVVLLAALTAVLIPSGIHMAAAYHQALAGCAATNRCTSLQNTLFQGDGLILDLVLATLAVPALLGMFVGAPLVAKEDEDGTLRLVWTQAVTRRAWLGVSAGWTLLGAAVITLLISALVAWWHQPEYGLFGRLLPGAFDIQGSVPIGYAVFGVALGIMIGSWVRRMLPAVAITLAAFAVVRGVVFMFVRPHLLAPIHLLAPLVGAEPAGSTTWWIITREVVDAGGQVTTTVPAVCSAAVRTDTVSNCLAAHGYQSAVTYQPDSRYGTLQGLETGLFLALAVACLAVAYWLVTTRDA